MASSEDDGRRLRPNLPKLVDLTISENEGNNQAQIGRNIRCNNGIGPIEGMENVVVTVSGYNDLLRTRLINLIAATGSSYTGSLTYVNTHVVCWKFRGPKFELAKKLGKRIINHRWFEECMQAGIQLPEAPYHASGEKSEPFLWDPLSLRRPSFKAGPSIAELDLGFPDGIRSRRRNAIADGVVSSKPNRTSGKTSDLLFGDPSSVQRPSSRAGSSLREADPKYRDATGSRRIVIPYEAVSTTPNQASGKASKPSLKDRSRVQRPSSRAGSSLRELHPKFQDASGNRSRNAGGKMSEPLFYDSSSLHRPSFRAGFSLRERDPRILDEIRTRRRNTVANGAVSSTPNQASGKTPEPLVYDWSSVQRPACRAGSSLRKLDPKFLDGNRSRRTAIANEAKSSRVVPCAKLQETTRSHSFVGFVGEESGNLHREVDHKISNPGVFERKRKEAFTPANTEGKRRRLVRKSELSAAAAAGALPSQVGRVGTMGDITNGGPANLSSDGALQRTATLERDDKLTMGGDTTIGGQPILSSDVARQRPATAERRDECTIACITIGGQPTFNSDAAPQRTATAERRDECTNAGITIGGQPTFNSDVALQRRATAERRNECTIAGITIGGQPTLKADAPLQRTSNLNRGNKCQERAGAIEVEAAGKSAWSTEVVCVICHADTKPTTEGMLPCGHLFCYACIRQWADQAKLRSPTCPLCKVAFDLITRRGMGKAGEDGKCAILEEKIVQICPQLPLRTNLPAWRTEHLCVACESTDTPELMLICSYCRERACHSFCLDPPRALGSSWYCPRCSQMSSRMPIW